MQTKHLQIMPALEVASPFGTFSIGSYTAGQSKIPSNALPRSKVHQSLFDKIEKAKLAKQLSQIGISERSSEKMQQ
jgi:hypothetical protein